MIEIKESGKQLSNACELYQLIPKDKLSRIFETSKTVGAECDYTFLGFEEVYKAVTLFVPKSNVIIDLGCAYAFQAWYFRDYRKYIGVDKGCSDALITIKELGLGNAEFYNMNICEFIREIFPITLIDPNESFAICSYVPDKIVREMVRYVFPHCLVYYPT